MKLTLHLQAANADTTASVSGDTLTHNGKAFDLSSIPEGGTAEPSGEHPFVRKITRQNGEIQAAILWQYDSATAEPDQGTEHPVVTLTSGAIDCPVVRKPEPEPEEEPEPEMRITTTVKLTGDAADYAVKEMLRKGEPDDV